MKEIRVRLKFQSFCEVLEGQGRQCRKYETGGFNKWHHGIGWREVLGS